MLDAAGNFLNADGKQIADMGKSEFSSNEMSTQFNWWATLDGKSLLLWKGNGLHIFEAGTCIEFADGTLSADANMKITFTPSAQPSTVAKMTPTADVSEGLAAETSYADGYEAANPVDDFHAPNDLAMNDHHA